MSKYYLLSPAKLKVKDANGWLELSKDDLLRTLDCLDGGQGLELQLPKIDGKLPVYNNSAEAKAAAIAASKQDPSCQYVLFQVSLSKKAKEELKAASKQHYRESGAFYCRLPYSEITLVNASLSHVSSELPSYKIEDSNPLQERLNKSKKSPNSPSNKIIFLFNSFLLLMLTFFTVGFIFTYSGMTAAIAASLIKMGLLQSSSITMNLSITATVSLLLWDFCMLAVVAGNGLLQRGQAQYERFKYRAAASTESTPQFDLLDDYGVRLEGFEQTLSSDEDASFTKVPLNSSPRPAVTPAYSNSSTSSNPSYVLMPADSQPAKSPLSRLRFW